MKIPYETFSKEDLDLDLDLDLNLEKRKKEETDIIFSAETIQTLKQFLGKEKYLNYQNTLHALYTLSQQLFILKEQNKNILFFDLDDIIVINSTTFIFINFSKILPTKENIITITKPISLKSIFLPPEFHKKLTLPLEVYDTTSYYSLALLLIYCLYGEKYTSYISKLSTAKKFRR